MDSALTGADEEDGIDEDQEDEDLLIEKFNVLGVTMDEHEDGGFGFS